MLIKIDTEITLEIGIVEQGHARATEVVLYLGMVSSM